MPANSRWDFNSGFKGLKYSVLIFVEKKIYLMQHLEGSGTPVLYILDARFLKVNVAVRNTRILK